MKINIISIALLIASFCSAQSDSKQIGSLKITNDGIHNTLINSGDVARINMGYDGLTGFINFGTHTGNGHRDNILYMRGSDGYVGIGTTQLTSSLSIGNNHGIKLSIGNMSWANKSIIQTGWDSQIGDYTEINVPGHAANNTLIRMVQSGNIGIGTTIPSAILDIYSPITAQGKYSSQKWSTSNPEYNLTLQTIWDNNGINQEFVQRFNGVDYSSLAFYGGNVGIGISKPDEKLTVNGKIHAKEVKIDLSFPVPDYVFANDYKLKSLQEVEEFIKQNSHLPEIPSAKEIEKNGLMLAEMNMSLLKKIEELTLYMIELKKANEKQNNQIQLQNDKIFSLEKKIDNKNTID